MIRNQKMSSRTQLYYTEVKGMNIAVFCLAFSMLSKFNKYFPLLRAQFHFVPSCSPILFFPDAVRSCSSEVCPWEISSRLSHFGGSRPSHLIFPDFESKETNKIDLPKEWPWIPRTLQASLAIVPKKYSGCLTSLWGECQLASTWSRFIRLHFPPISSFLLKLN